MDTVAKHRSSGTSMGNNSSTRLVVHTDDLRLAVGDECFVLGFGEE
jgi:hypothetical protein